MYTLRDKKLKEITELSNKELLELWARLVREDCYSPFKTPEDLTLLQNSGVSQEDLQQLVLERMQSQQGYIAEREF